LGISIFIFNLANFNIVKPQSGGRTIEYSSNNRQIARKTKTKDKTDSFRNRYETNLYRSVGVYHQIVLICRCLSSNWIN